VSQLAVVVVLEKRVTLLSVVIGVCVGCTCDSGRCGRPVLWVAVAECAEWAWWRCTVMLFCPIEDRGEADGRFSSVAFKKDCALWNILDELFKFVSSLYSFSVGSPMFTAVPRDIEMGNVFPGNYMKTRYTVCCAY
jgi:hypothetical protein